MDGWDLALAVRQRTLLGGHVPHNLIDRVILHLVEDAVGADQHVVDRVGAFDLVGNLRLASNDTLDAA